MITITDKLNGIEKIEKRLALQKGALLEKAIKSTDPSALMKASEILQNVETREESNRKSLILDPNDFRNFMGYKEKPVALSYSTLRRISYVVPVIRSIIATRINQISSFCQPQSSKYSTGFIIRKKQRYYGKDANKKLTKAEEKRIDELTDMILNCGVDGSFEGDDFEEFTRKIWNDSYTFDQLNFEIIRTRRGEIHSFTAADAATIRIADSFDDDTYEQEGHNVLNRKKIKGYYPSYCQVYMSEVVADFYPWEMCFGIRNPTTNIYSNGYGFGEIEILINTITSLLWADEYNRKFFTQGSAPKGLLKIKSGTNVNDDKLAMFKQQWQAMMAGVQNSWKTPILEGDIDWIDLQKSNRDMEFSKWLEFLIKIACAVFSIDPAEVNFPLSGGSEQKSMFEGNNEARLKHSRDKGLRPALKFYERKLNKYILNQADPNYEFVFVGLDDDQASDIERDDKLVRSSKSIDEIRVARGDDALGADKGGDLILDPIWWQWKSQQQMMDQQMAMTNAQGGRDPQDEYGDQTGELDKNPAAGPGMANEPDVFAKAFEQYWDKLMNEDK